VAARKIPAAGGLVWRGPSERPDIAVIHRPRYDDWSLPKGKLHHDEHPVLGACREVTEETGCIPAMGRRLPSQRYKVPEGEKIVDYWSMRCLKGEFQPGDEVDRLDWLDADATLDRLTYERDREIVRGFLAGPVPTAAILLVRHARAGDKSSWKDDDRLRPLDAVGAAQADRLRAGLACWAPALVVSADRVRCVQTVAPLAADLGLTVGLEPTLNEEACASDPDAAVERIRQLARARGPTVVCSQGGAIPTIVGTLAKADGVDLSTTDAKKASTWALSFVGGELVAAEYFRSFG
jgi:8-oxo-(d)GTP phosphatase